ncbi:polyphosphate kinase 2 family protein [Algibacillus agarilyticus]|uniref:polyphosphate kinase 2 family protein n=1 Tax=Algibacillus agarilyticus TaxID=2234133 RepID=UPI001E3C8824|nr:polyphosphate kinase [Algibacillus agarilyticus]
MYSPSKIKRLKPSPTLTAVQDNESSLSFENDADYYQQLTDLQYQLLLIQQAYFQQGRRAIIVFEGWDASGKGGVIRRLTEKLDPRGFMVHPIAAPTADEQSRHYLYRFQTKLPKAGQIAIFDRSYYGRVLVERVEGFASKPQWQRAYQEINEFERLLTDDGVVIIKLFLHISPEQQLKRFVERLHNPQKHWKLTQEDLRNREQWPNYEKAINKMFKHTSTIAANWQVLNANNKKQTRLNALKIITQLLAQDVDLTPPPLDEELVKQANKLLGLDDL